MIPSNEEGAAVEVNSAIDAFDSALRTRSYAVAEAVWALHRDDVSIFGSAAGEDFRGPAAVRECLVALTSRTTAHGWRWVDRTVSVAGDVAWFTANAFWVTIHPDGSETERPYRVTGVLINGAHGWQWCQYHGSEPLGSIG